jgi:hypothetical protein
MVKYRQIIKAFAFHYQGCLFFVKLVNKSQIFKVKIVTILMTSQNSYKLCRLLEE